MRRHHIALCLAVLIATPAWAAPKGNGNFRRVEAIKLVKPSSTSRVSVRGLATINNHLQKQARQPKGGRVLFVDEWNRKVTLVVAPVNKSKPVRLLGQREANRLGLLMPEQAAAQAQFNGGMYGIATRVTLKQAGLGSRGNSYSFTQKAPLGYSIKEKNPPKFIEDVEYLDGDPLHSQLVRRKAGPLKVTGVQRMVPVTGGAGESAMGYYKRVTYGPPEILSE